MLFTGKLNKMRNYAMLTCFFGIGIMYIGYAGFAGYFGEFLYRSMIFMTVFLFLGLIFIFGSAAFYMYIGMLSANAPLVRCPNCKKVTKMIGTTDDCMYCKQTLSTDPKYAPSNQAERETLQ